MCTYALTDNLNLNPRMLLVSEIPKNYVKSDIGNKCPKYRNIQKI